MHKIKEKKRKKEILKESISEMSEARGWLLNINGGHVPSFFSSLSFSPDMTKRELGIKQRITKKKKKKKVSKPLFKDLIHYEKGKSIKCL